MQPVIVEKKDPYFKPRYVIIIKHSTKTNADSNCNRVKMPETKSRAENAPATTPRAAGVIANMHPHPGLETFSLPAKPKGYHPVLESFEFPAKPKET
jgi:hypothetical protein